MSVLLLWAIFIVWMAIGLSRLLSGEILAATVCLAGATVPVCLIVRNSKA